MKIGKPRRIHRVEPLREPVPAKAPPAPVRPEQAPSEPKEAPVK